MNLNIERVLINDKNYPLLLKEIPNPPKQIFISGQLPKPNQICIAIVGTRKASTLGKNMARQIAKELAQLNIVIVSGLAMGLDTSAHFGALDAKGLSAGRQGKTIAVLANGLDKIYPAQNENLAKQILENNGSLISEYPIGTPSLPHQFLDRNRIISGLCQAVIVIEAPDRSGSLATARHALEQGREVLVMPGPANHPNYIGSHKLIRDGARLITSTQDVLEDLGLEIPNSHSPTGKLISNEILNEQTKNLSADCLSVIKTLQEAGEPLAVDKISILTKLEPQVANQIIATLVIEEIIKETEQGYTI